MKCLICKRTMKMVTNSHLKKHRISPGEYANRFGVKTRSEESNQKVSNSISGIIRSKKPISDRFWEKVKKTPGCWEWVGSKTRLGYGIFNMGGRKILAHRLGYELQVGPISKNIDVLHNCDNPPCVRGDHLFLGTQIDNVRDMDKKGRRRTADHSGENNPMSKLTREQVVQIRENPNGYTRYRLSKIFGVEWSTIDRIQKRKLWKDQAS